MVLPALAWLAALLAVGVPEDEVIELERPVARRPDDGTFARAHAAPWASGRRCLVAFHGAGRAEWRFTLREPRRVTLWLRYAAASEVSLPFGMGALAEAALEPVVLPATGATSGKHAWGLAPVFTGELAAGEHAFTFGAAPLRPDCVLVGGDARPTALDPPPVAALSTEEAALLAQPLSPPRPGWLEGFAGRRAPDWYERTRLCLHTRFGPPWVMKPEFERVATAFSSLGARSFVRHLRTRGEGQWWPSQGGASAEWGDSPALALGVVQRAREEGLFLVAYYRHLEDRELALSHPDWRCRDDRGAPLFGRNGDPRICINSPYLDRLETRLLELVGFGVDGIYFDEDHWPRDGCWCRSCAAGFQVFAGLELPARLDHEDPRYRRLLEFGALSMERAFARLSRSVHRANPEVALLIGSHRAPDPLEHFASDRLWRVADGVKTEFGKGHGVRLRTYLRSRPELVAPARDAWLALGWTYCRDAAEGRPPHVWCNAITDARVARAAAAAVIAWGGVANLDVQEERIPDADVFGPAVVLGNRLSDALAGARPERWAALHWPGALREHLADADEVFERLAAPLGAAFEAVLRARRPVGIVTDSLLAEGALEGYRVLLLTAPEALGADQRAAVERFRVAGGHVLEFRGTWDLERLSELDGPGWAVEGGPAGLHVVAHRAPDGALLLALSNDPSFVWTEPRVNRAGRPLELPPGVDVPPAVCEGVTVRLPPGMGRALDATTGRGLPVEDGVVRVPAFDVIRLLRIEE